MQHCAVAVQSWSRSQPAIPFVDSLEVYPAVWIVTIIPGGFILSRWKMVLVPRLAALGTFRRPSLGGLYTVTLFSISTPTDHASF